MSRAEQITLEEFAESRTLRENREISRCGCNWPRCQGWCEITIDPEWPNPWGKYYAWEAPVDFIGPLLSDL